MSGPRWLMVVAALMAVAVLAAMLWPWATEPEAPAAGLPVPPRGDVIAAFAGDGHPVWVIGHLDGRISVLDALSTHVPFAINKPTWWCPRSRVIEDPFHGARYDEFGEPVGGPAPRGLRPYAFQLEADQLFIGEASAERPMSPSAGSGAAGCTAADGPLVHDYTTLPEAESPMLAQAADDGWIRLHATLVPAPETRSGLLCPKRVEADICAEVGLPGIEHLLSTPGDRAAESLEAWTDTDWLAHVLDGRIVEISLVVELEE